MAEITLVAKCGRCGEEVSIPLAFGELGRREAVDISRLLELKGMENHNFGIFPENDDQTEKMICGDCLKDWNELNAEWKSNWKEKRNQFFARKDKGV